MATSTIEVSIFHTNDMHGRLEAMSRLSHFARRLRREATEAGRTVFFWDAGDAADRRVRLCSVTKGAAFSAILNAMGYDLQTMGNAIALPYGPQAMADVAARADFPILAANCRDGDGPLPAGLQPHALISLPHERTIGVLGLTAPWGNLYESFGLHLPDFRDVARDTVRQLQEQGGAPIIVLSHLGLEDDRRLAEEVDGIDAIIGAHSHDLLPTGEEHNGVFIAQAGEYAQAVGRVDLTIDADTGRVLSRSAQVLEVPEDEPADPAVEEAIATAEREVDTLLQDPIGELRVALDLDHFDECGIGNLAADALRAYMDAEAALVMSGQLHAGLPAGIVTRGDLNAACFSSANPYATDVRGEQILMALERGLTPDIARFEHHGLRGTPIGIPQISGMVVEYDPDGAAGARIQRVLIGGEPLDPDLHYRLAHTDAETIREHGYLVLDEEQLDEHDTPTILPEVLAAYLRSHSPVPEPPAGRWVRLHYAESHL